MSVGFGFSVGDFISAIELVGTVIDALRSSGSAATEYRELVSQLLSLETALLQVKRLEFEEGQYTEVIALRQAAAQCQRTIDGFWKKAQKYQPHLSCDLNGGARPYMSQLKAGLMKIKWAVCKKGDVESFKAGLKGHTESIVLLLATVQMSKSAIHEQRQDEQQKSLVGRVQEGYFNCMQRLGSVAEQGKQLLEMTVNVLQVNVKVFQIVLEIQQAVMRIPGQVERQQPVYLLDALGKASPFHLEFVRSAEALVAVLKINFQKHGSGAEKIERGEFAIQDSVTKRDIDLRTDWEVCFSPGQRVDMSMIFFGPISGNVCIKCGYYLSSLEENSTGDRECPSCGLTVRNVDATDSKTSGLDLQHHRLIESAQPRKRKAEDEDDWSSFRRVRFHRLRTGINPRAPQQTRVEYNNGLTEEELLRTSLRGSITRKPRITKADRALMAQEKLEREKMGPLVANFISNAKTREAEEQGN